MHVPRGYERDVGVPNPAALNLSMSPCSRVQCRCRTAYTAFVLSMVRKFSKLKAFSADKSIEIAIFPNTGAGPREAWLGAASTLLV